MLTISTQVLGQEYRFIKEDNKKDVLIKSPEDDSNLGGLDAQHKKAQIPEWGFSYYYVGKTILSINNRKREGYTHGFGYIRLANNLRYGMRHTQLAKENDFKLNQTVFTMGYTPLWNYRIKPYIDLGLGYAIVEDRLNKVKANGYINTLDVGFKVKEVGNFHFNSGMRFGIINTNSTDVSNTSFQEFYTIIGFEFQ